jgi:hypothetical protein
MKKRILTILNKIPGGRFVLTKYAHLNRLFNSNSFLLDRFTNIYKDNAWGNDESVSGPGSTAKNSELIGKELPGLFKNLDVKTILDVPCGDFNWFRFVLKDLNVSYIGGDIVKQLIIENEKKYGNEKTRFIHLDITKDKLPKGDLLLCRDCLFHLSYKDIFLFLQNFLISDIKYLLTTTYTKCNMNENIISGRYRQLNLEKPPFSFCKAKHYMDDSMGRSLALWEKQVLYNALINNKACKL